MAEGLLTRPARWIFVTYTWYIQGQWQFGSEPNKRNHPVSSLWRYVWRTVDRMDTQEWVIVLFAMIFVGFICMRGFGSRHDY